MITIVGEWCGAYSSFAELKVNGRTFFMGTRYWTGKFPAEIPFEIKLPL